MGVPLRLKDANGNLQEFTSAQENYIAYQIGKQLFRGTSPDLWGTTLGGGPDSALGSIEIQLAALNYGSFDSSTWTNIGSFTDTKFGQPPGTHPSTSITITTSTNNMWQDLSSTALEDSSAWRRPIEVFDSGGFAGIKEMDDTSLNDAVDRYLSIIFTNDYVGTYKFLETPISPPISNGRSGDYLLSQSIFGYHADTQQSGNIKSYVIARRETMTAPTVARPLKLVRQGDSDQGVYQNGIQEMTDEEIRVTFGQRAKTRIVQKGIGKYQLRSSAQGAPTDPGTWVAKSTLLDTRKQTADQNFTSAYTNEYIFNFTRNSTTDFVGNYEATYATDYLTDYVAYYITDYLADYTTVYEPPGYVTEYASLFETNYAGTYTGNFIGNYVANFTINSTAAFVGNFIGDFIGDYEIAYEKHYDTQYISNYIGNFIGNYVGNFIGDYARNFTRDSTAVFSLIYTGDFTGNFIGNFIGNYDGQEFALNYQNNYVGNFIGDFTGYALREYAGNYVREYLRNFVTVRPIFYVSTGDVDFIGNYLRASNYQRLTAYYTRDYLRSVYYQRTVGFVSNSNYTGPIAGGPERAYTGGGTDLRRIIPVIGFNTVPANVVYYQGNFFGSNYLGNTLGDQGVYTLDNSNQYGATFIGPAMYIGSLYYLGAGSIGYLGQAAYQNRSRYMIFSHAAGTGTPGNPSSGFGQLAYVGPAPVGATATYLGPTLYYVRTLNYLRSIYYQRSFAGFAQYLRDVVYAGNYISTFEGNYDGGVTFEGNYEGNFATDFVGEYLATYTRDRVTTYIADFVGNYIATFTRDRTQDFTRNSTADFLGNYTGNFIGDYEGAYTRDSTQDFTRDSTNTFVNVNTQLYATDYLQNFTRNSTADATVTYTGDFEGNYATDFTRDSTNTFDTIYTGTFEGAFSTSYIVTYSTDYQTAYAAEYAQPYESRYVADYVTDYISNFIGDFLGDYERAFSINYVGDFIGETIQSTSETIETYTLYVRIA